MLFIPEGFDEDGVVNAVTSGTVTGYQDGQAYVGNLPLVSTTAVAATDFYHRGFRYKADGSLKVAASAPVNWCEGVGLTATGQVCYVAGPITTTDLAYLGGGMAMTESGKVYATVV